MGWTKRQFVQKAFGKIGLGQNEFDVGTEALQDALTDLEAMMATWSGKGIKVGYPIASEPENASLDTETDVPASANLAIFLKLALLIAPDVGKVVSPELKAAADFAYDELVEFSKKDQIQEMQMPGYVPRGAGQKPWRETRNNYVNQPSKTPLDTDSDGKLIFRG